MGSKPSGSLFGAAGVDFADKLASAFGGAGILGFFSVMLGPGLGLATLGLLPATVLDMGTGLAASTALVPGTIGAGAVVGAGAGAGVELVVVRGGGGLCRACNMYQPADADAATITAATASHILLLRLLADAGVFAAG